jgi:thioredoxin-related protein
MNRIGRILTAVVLIAGGTLFAQPHSATKNLKWEPFNVGIERAKTDHKKVLIDIYAVWCSWCEKMDDSVYTDENVKDYISKNFVVIKMDAEAAGTLHYNGKDYSPAQLAAAFGVNGFPATLFLKDDSEPITLLPGYVDARMFLHVLSYIAENQYESKHFEDYLKERGFKQ